MKSHLYHAESLLESAAKELAEARDEATEGKTQLDSAYKSARRALFHIHAHERILVERAID